MSENEGLKAIIEATGAHEALSADERGPLIMWTCGQCGKRSWSYERYLAPGLTIEDGREFLAAQHQCKR